MVAKPSGWNPVIPLVAQTASAFGLPGRDRVHFGASQDILDTAAVLVSRRARLVIAAVGAVARRAGALAGLVSESVTGEHERHLTSWPVEWQSLGELLALAGGAAARTSETVCGLEVDTEVMSARVRRLAGALLTERVSLVLAERIGRAEARRAVEEAGRNAANTTAAGFAASLLSNSDVAAILTASELDDLLDPNGYLGSNDTWIDRALAYHAECERSLHG